MSQNIVNGLKKTKVDNTDINKIINQHPRLVRIKKKAKVLKKEEQYKDTPLSSLLDIASKELGFKHWHEVYTNIKNLYFPKSYKLEELYSFGLSKPKNMEEGIHLGYNPNMNMNLWLDNKNLLEHITIFGENNERQKLHSYLLKQALKNNYSLTLIDNTSLIKDLEVYIKEENIQRDIYKLKVVSHQEYLHSPYKDKINKTTQLLLNGYIENTFNEIFYEQKFEGYSQKEKEQIKALGNIVFDSFNCLNGKSHSNPSSYSKDDYYKMIKETVNYEHLLKEYKNETFSKGYINKNGNTGTYPQIQTNIKHYLTSLEDFDVNSIHTSTLKNHDKLKKPLIEYLDYLENNLYFYFEDAEKSVNDNDPRFEHAPYIYSISISPSLLQYDEPIIAHLMTNIIYQNAYMVDLFRNLDTAVLKKEIKPITNKILIFIKDCPLLSKIDRLLNVAKSSNTALIFSYENEHTDYIEKYRAAFCVSQYVFCESKAYIMENNVEEIKNKDKYHEENVYMYYVNNNLTKEDKDPIYHPIVIDFHKYNEDHLLKRNMKKSIK